MYNVDLQWKAFNVDLGMVESWLRGLEGSNYLGTSADTDLTLHFAAKPTDDHLAQIATYWDEVIEGGQEHARYCTQATIAAAIQTLREGLIAKEWADMSVAERKIAVGLTPSRADLGL